MLDKANLTHHNGIRQSLFQLDFWRGKMMAFWKWKAYFVISVSICASMQVPVMMVASQK